MLVWNIAYMCFADALLSRIGSYAVSVDVSWIDWDGIILQIDRAYALYKWTDGYKKNYG